LGSQPSATNAIYVALQPRDIQVTTCRDRKISFWMLLKYHKAPQGR
jgi:hypothetical protein